MLNPVYFNHHRIMVKDTCETILPNSKFGERTTGQRFQIICRIPPIRVDNLVEFRNDSILDVRIQSIEFGAARWVNCQVQPASFILSVSHHLYDFFS